MSLQEDVKIQCTKLGTPRCTPSECTSAIHKAYHSVMDSLQKSHRHELRQLAVWFESDRKEDRVRTSTTTVAKGALALRHIRQLYSILYVICDRLVNFEHAYKNPFTREQNLLHLDVLDSYMLLFENVHLLSADALIRELLTCFPAIGYIHKGFQPLLTVNDKEWSVTMEKNPKQLVTLDFYTRVGSIVDAFQTSTLPEATRLLHAAFASIQLLADHRYLYVPAEHSQLMHAVLASQRDGSRVKRKAIELVSTHTDVSSFPVAVYEACKWLAHSDWGSFLAHGTVQVAVEVGARLRTWLLGYCYSSIKDHPVTFQPTVSGPVYKGAMKTLRIGHDAKVQFTMIDASGQTLSFGHNSDVLLSTFVSQIKPPRSNLEEVLRQAASQVVSILPGATAMAALTGDSSMNSMVAMGQHYLFNLNYMRTFIKSMDRDVEHLIATMETTWNKLKTTRSLFPDDSTFELAQAALVILIVSMMFLLLWSSGAMAMGGAGVVAAAKSVSWFLFTGNLAMTSLSTIVSLLQYIPKIEPMIGLFKSMMHMMKK